jgi:hypothetical protein
MQVTIDLPDMLTDKILDKWGDLPQRILTNFVLDAFGDRLIDFDELKELLAFKEKGYSEEEIEKLFPTTQNAIISPIKESKRALFGVMKDSGKILGDIIEPTSNLVTWDVVL